MRVRDLGCLGFVCCGSSTGGAPIPYSRVDIGGWTQLQTRGALPPGRMGHTVFVSPSYMVCIRDTRLLLPLLFTHSPTYPSVLLLLLLLSLSLSLCLCLRLALSTPLTTVMPSTSTAVCTTRHSLTRCTACGCVRPRLFALRLSACVDLFLSVRSFLTQCSDPIC